jgi:hypothetical protein
MNYFAGNIDENNISLLEAAGSDTGIDFEKGAYMTLSDNGIKHHSFHPIFCENEEQAIGLFKQYVTDVRNSKANSLSNDLFVAQVGKKI